MSCSPATAQSFESLVTLALWRADRHPDRAAYVFLGDGEIEEPVLTYGGLLREAERVAGLLQERGIRDEPVILAYEASLAFTVAFWGCILSGNIAVPTYSPRGEHRIRGLSAIIENSGASTALTHGPYVKNLARVLDHFPVLQGTTWIRTDTEDARSARTYHPGRMNPTAVLQYTSGSTGKPKGVQITHANVLSNEEAMRLAFDHDENAVVINCLPHYHDMGLFGSLLQPFYAGGLCVSMSPVAFVQKPARLLNAITKYHGTSCGGPNFVYSLCADKPGSPDTQIDLRTWRNAFIGAERIRPEVQARFLKTFAPYGFRKEAFRSCYGLAEATLLVSMDENNEHLTERESHVNGRGKPASAVVSCGVSYGRQSFLIVDPVTREVCTQGQEGEVWLEGGNIASGYWQNPLATGDVFGAFTADGRGPFLRTGDSGYTVNGELFIAGRINAFIIVDGENFHAEDLEAAVADSHPAIEGGKCMAIRIERDGQDDFVVIAEVARTHMRNFDAQSPGDKIYKRLVFGHGLAPCSIFFVKAGGVPSTPNGKINRHAGPAMLDSGQLPILGEWHRKIPSVRHARVTFEDSGMSLSEWLRAVIAQQIGIDPQEIPMDQPFASLGVDSLGLIMIAEELSVRTGKEIDVTVMWEYPTITELTSHLSG